MNSRLESRMLPPTIGKLSHHRVLYHKNERLHEVTNKVQPYEAPGFKTMINQPSHRLPHLNSHSRRLRQFLGAAAAVVAVVV